MIHSSLSNLYFKKIVFFYFFIFVCIQTTSLTFISRAQAGTELTFASMNLHCQFEDWRWRLTQVGQWLAKYQPAIAFFQEVCDGQGQSMSTEIPEIFKKAGYGIVASKALFSHDAWDGKYKEHLLVVTRFANPEWFGGVLPGKGMRRVYLGLKVQDTNFIGIHLTADKQSQNDQPVDDPEADQSRLDQTRFLTEHFASPLTLATLFMGDFNSNPSEPEQQPFHDHACHAYFTGPTEPLPKPRSAIDGAWLTEAFSRKIFSAHLEKALDQPINGHFLSDHAAVLLHVLTH